MNGERTAVARHFLSYEPIRQSKGGDISMKRRLAPSLRGRITMMVLVCWLVPILLIWTISFLLSDHSLRTRIDASLAESTAYATSQVTEALDDAIAMSRRASFDNVFFDAYMSGDVLTSPDVYFKVFSSLANTFRRNTTIEFAAMYYYGYEEHFISYTEKPRLANDPLSGDVFMQHLPAIKKMAEGSGAYISFYQVDDSVYIIRNLLTNKNYTPFGTLVVKLNTRTLTDAYTYMALQTDTHIVRLSDYRGDNAFSLPTSNPLLDTLSPGPQQLWRQENSVCSAQTKRYSDYTFGYYVQSNYSKNAPELAYSMNVTIALLLGVMPLLVYLLVSLEKQVSLPIRQLVSMARKLEDEQFGVQTDFVAQTEEFLFLSTAINHMSIRLQDLFERGYREQLLLKDAKIAALQSQINPHFFNNTLELINWQARRNGDEMTGRLIESLGTLVGMATDRDNTNQIALAQELDCVDAYLYITSVRYGKRLSVARDIDEALLQQPIARMCLQPLVENAVLHGIDRHKETQIVLRVYQTDSHCCIEISNSGTLTEEDRIAIDKTLATKAGKLSTEGRRSIGLANVYARLVLLYGRDDVLTYQSQEGLTTFLIQLPLFGK